MIEQEQIVREKIAGFLKWEQIKRREKTLVSSFFYALLISSFLLPAQPWLPGWLGPFSLLLFFFIIVSICSFLLRPWTERDCQRTLWRADSHLGLAARTLTAREILKREEKKPPELLVLREAGKKLAGIDPRRLFKRKYSWDFFVTPLFFLFWLLSVWFDVGLRFDRRPDESERWSTSRKLMTFSSEVKDKAKSQGLIRSLETADNLKNLAEQNMKGQLSEKSLNENLDKIAGRIGEMIAQSAQTTQMTGVSPARTDQQSMADLRAEIEAFKGSFALQQPARWENGLAPELIGKLASLPHLSGEIESRLSPADKMNRKELADFVESLERNLKAQLDRLTLSEIRQYLEQLLQTEGVQTLQAIEQEGREGPGELLEGKNSRAEGMGIGTEPGAKEEKSRSPSIQAGAPKQLKGQLKEGKRTGLSINAEPQLGKSKVPDEEVAAAYRRQAEEDLASEKIPEGLKETIRRYFLSLGKAGEKE